MNVINTLGCLKDFLNSLSEDQLQQPCIALLEEQPGQFIANAEIVLSPVLHNTQDKDDAGTFEELKQIHGEEFIEEDYTITHPEGTVLFYLTTENPANEN